MDQLLENFNENRQDDITNIQRKVINKSDSAKNEFYLGYKDRNYKSQYYEMYKFRLSKLRERVRKECLSKWNSNGFTLSNKKVVEKKRVLDVQGNEPCWCIGTIYCEMKFKPNVFEEIVSDQYSNTNNIKNIKNYTDPDGSDEIMLEDESGRIILCGELIKNTPFITGTVVGLLGMEAEAGSFQVLDICYPQAIPQLPVPTSNNNIKGKKIMFLSGLNINTTTPSNLFRAQLLQEYILGRINNDNDTILNEISSISKIIICGNSIESNVNLRNKKDNGIGDLLSCIQEFNKILINILQSIPIEIIPGEKDPSDKGWPQQPFNKSLFGDELKPYFDVINDELLKCGTNPYSIKLEQYNILITSGTNIDDICKYIVTDDGEDNDEKADTIEHRLDIMESTMRWQNIAPNAPDTIISYPYLNKDPFILDEWPNLYVVGNQKEFGVRDMTDPNIKIISVPVFSSTGEVVIMDLETLDCNVLKFEL
ncbi:hypothetical protein TBLA_0H02190 [Henningerozyma blattae CBS 6284]|uniref:DNA-directed DNA polymerase n=1 Tax=Henningerozyma blattae (strain ATCC 34711 / CBS 6284 / DSM 70876 / NBRC 10599 / NRRL Y-10934 / UCD 77-7) TaxID=1071380 RepID=I2H803_HENB6|nr:hypothetical protein TBLA_0H02190 [Tetrapisispora blattae CBS 6284]CCH62505.1 hypothetical protein TBLA_0H02190 [Tetrapisispora blattae CBS 6284]